MPLTLVLSRFAEEARRAPASRRGAELGAYALGDYLGALAEGRSSGEFFDARLYSRAIGRGDFTEVFELDAAVGRRAHRAHLPGHLAAALTASRRLNA